MIKATGAQIITGILERKGIKTVAGIPGGSILPLYDELAKSNIKHILVRQEQAGGFIAQGIARTTGKAAVCFATSGPGAMNLLTAIADARSDSIPLVSITGQVNRALIGTDAFQETDTFGLSMPICKHSVMVKSAAELLKVLPEAFRIAESGRQGPVIVDVPRDVQLETCTFLQWPDMKDYEWKPSAPANLDALASVAADLFAKARRIVLFCGGGTVYSDGAPQLIQKLSEKYRIPVCTSLMGLTVVPADSELFLGMVGMHGSYTANRVMYESDLIIALGIRFDDRATGTVSKFCPNAKIIHIDVDAAEINKIYQSSVAISCDCATALKVLAKKLESDVCVKAAQESASFWKKLIPECAPRMCGIYDENLFHPSVFMKRIEQLCTKLLKKPPYITTDVGQHQMFTAQCYPMSFPRQLLTSGSLGTMGFGLPAAIGTALANPDRRIICFSGDGSILMNVQELATLYELGLYVTVIVLDNQCLGMVRQQQELIFNGNYSASIYEKTPDLCAVAEGFHIPSYDITDEAGFDEKLTQALLAKGPSFVRIPVKQEYNVLPFVFSGKANIEAFGLK